jgi:anti-anti-sigma factor
MQVTETREGEVIQLSVEGRVDTTTAPDLQKQILDAFQKVRHVVIDFMNVEYISSAGLRALLLGQKTATSKGGSLKILNVNDAVKQVFDMSGFSKILTIE